MNIYMDRLLLFRAARVGVALLMGATLILALAGPAAAKGVRRGTNAITHTSEHLPQRDKPAPGREMHRPAVPEPPQRELIGPRAEIPDPTPQLRAAAGGRSVRRGQYFYALPRPVALADQRVNLMRRRNESVPNPVIRRRPVSATLTRAK
jgi:hypothetical protein